MAENEYTRRRFLRDVGFTGGGLFLLTACTSRPASRHDRPGVGRGGAGLPDVEGGQVVTDATMLPRSFAESPEFAALTAAGKLPPVAERIGRDPLVIKPVGEIGKYGGTIRRASSASATT